MLLFSHRVHKEEVLNRDVQIEEVLELGRLFAESDSADLLACEPVVGELQIFSEAFE